MANKKSKQIVPKWAYGISAIVILIVLVTIYFCVPTVKNWVNGLFSASTGTETEQPQDPADELEKAETPTNVPYVVTGTTITLMKISNAEYSLDCVFWQDSNVFENLQPVTTYNVFVRIKETNQHYASDVCILEITTDKESQESPNTSDITYTATGTSIKLNVPSGVESSRNNGETWVSDNHFVNLEPLTEYLILVRYKETDTYYASQAVIITANTTKSTEHDTPSVEVTGITSSSIVLTDSRLVEYSIDNGQSWQESNIFSGLTPATQYTVLARYKETDTHLAGNSTSLVVSTLATNESGLFNNDGTLVRSWQQLLDVNYITVTDGVLDTNPYWDTAQKNDIFNCNLIIDNSVLEIAESAFYDTDITSVTIPESVTVIGESAFESCGKLQTITFAENSNLRTIGDQAFWSANMLREVVFPDGLETIGAGVFTNCSLDSVYIPASVSSIDDTAFGSCGKFIVASDNLSYKSENGVLFDKNGTTLIRYPDDATTSYTIPNSVVIIGDFAFAYTTNLANIIIPEGVTTIGNRAFYGGAFEIINLPASVTTIGDLAFGGYDLTAINVAAGNTAFESIEGVLYSANGTELVAVPMAISNTDLVIPEGCVTVREQVLSILVNMTSISIPSTLTDLGGSANYSFGNCNDLISITVAANNPVYKSVDGVLYSKDGTILYCYPSQKTEAVFYVPETVTQIHDMSAISYDNLQALIFQSAIPPNVTISSVLFPDSSLVIYVPDAALEEYQSAYWFRNHTGRIKPVSEYTA